MQYYKIIIYIFDRQIEIKKLINLIPLYSIYFSMTTYNKLLLITY